MSTADSNAHTVPPLHLGAAGCDHRGVYGAPLEEFLDAWVFAARDAELAFSAWASSTNGERAMMYTAYRAALDREERAAQLLAVAASSSGVTTADRH